MRLRQRISGPWVERGALAVLLAVSAAAWVFAELADAVREGEATAFDRALLLAMRTSADLSDPIGPPWVEEMARDFTALGGVGVLTLVVLAVAGFIGLHKRVRTMLFVLVAAGGGALLSAAFKAAFGRARPDLVPHEVAVHTASFPSGHSMMSAAVYLTLGAMLARMQPTRLLKVYVVLLAALLAGVVGASRVYLGVHWPTDVLAGWTAGAGWALLCLGLARMLARRRRIETEPSED